jgi:hypothetical protein
MAEGGAVEHRPAPLFRGVRGADPVTLSDPLPPLTPGQRRSVWIATLAIGIARACTMAASPLDWDEMQMLLGLRDYDILFHRPHPPGFPLFIAAAKVLHLAGVSDFAAFQVLNALAATALFPLALFAFREMRFPLRTAVIGSALLAVMPNIWFLSGGAFSDVPAAALVLAAVGFLLRGCRSGGAYLAGAVLTGAVGAIRPQILPIVAAPALIATWSCLRARRWPVVAIGAAAGAAVIGAAYGTAIWVTGWGRFVVALRWHQDFLMTVDVGRVPLFESFDDFFVRPYRAPVINAVSAALALAGIGRGLVLRRMSMLLALGTFAPYAIAAWLFLSAESTGRYSVAYAPLIAVAIADGIAAISIGRRNVEVALASVLAATMAGWALPSILFVHRHESPPVAAMRWIRARADPRTSLLYVHETVLPFAWYYLARYEQRQVHDRRPPRMRTRDAYFVTEGRPWQTVATFAWPKNRLWDLARQRYFVVSVVSTSAQIEFGSGWYGEESAGGRRWRWMSSRGVAHIRGEEGSGQLRLAFDLPPDLLARRPEITVFWNGGPIERVRPNQRKVERTYRLAGPGELVLTTSEVMNLRAEGRGDDPRDLGLMLEEMTWVP